MNQVARGGAGNTSQKADYEYDSSDGVVTKMTYGNGAYVKYDYNGSGALTKISHYSAGATLIASNTYEFDEAGNVTKLTLDDNLGAIGGIICRECGIGILPMNTGGTPVPQRYHYDRLGNVVGVTDASGNVVSLYTMQAFGNVLEMTNGGDFSKERSTDIQSYHLTTKEYDTDSGLDYFNARWYDCETARFLGREPTAVDGPNLYHYGFNCAPNGFDPDGLGWRDW